MNDDKTVVSYPIWAWILVWVGFPLVGAGVIWLLKAFAGWVANLKWAPLQGPFRLIDSIPEPQATIGALALGAVAGLILALLTAQDSLTVTVGRQDAHIRRGGSQGSTYPRDEVTGVFVDAKHLVMLGGPVELAREKSDLEDRELRRAFEGHGWPWLEADPHRAEFRRWVEDDPDLPPAGNAILRARATAVRKDNTADMVEFRQELAKLGVVVRDERKKQYWRLVRS